MTAKNIKNFYRFDALNISKGELNFQSPKVKMTIKNGSDNLYINTVLFRLSYKVTQKNGHYLFSRIDLAKLIDPVLRPSYIKTAKRFGTVIIDPGHGGTDPGSVNRYGKEKDFNLRLAKILMKDLERKGFRVRMTRSSDVYPSLGQRVSFANRIPDAIFVSIHFNSFVNSTAKGIETYALSPRGSGTHNSRGVRNNFLEGNRRDSENIALATAVHAAVMKKTQAEDRGIKRDRFTVLAGLSMPAVLLEGGFLSNPAEAKKIASTSYLSIISQGIANGIVTYRNALR
ncbi:MAG: N-acetylmuramoyl-L-alanine amidase [Verrucomicrobiota bacterium]|nr:N-acetylmuramoyl-L-alanine amidase [Verrucomicrobiota bacterium]MEC7638315.1 N-acetylmuramoyl-L-alanine amidase [Verrucomicrobiota bacterium]